MAGPLARVGVGLLLALPMLPAVVLLGLSLGGADYSPVAAPRLHGRFSNSAIVALLVAGGSFCLGLPIGVLNALYEYRGRQLSPSPVYDAAAGALVPLGARLAVAPHAFGPLVAAPALRPFRLCAGVSSRSGRSGLVHRRRLHGRAVRLASGGRPSCRRGRNTFSMGLSSRRGTSCSRGRAGRRLDFVGPRRRLRRWPSMASTEILISFSAFYNYGLAGRQCLILTLIVLAVALPLACLAAPHLVAEQSARQLRGHSATVTRDAKRPAVATFALVLMLTVLPALGLILPLRRWTELERARAATSPLQAPTR